MDKVARTVGIDLAKKVFHVAEMAEDGTVLKRRRLRRAGLQSYLAQLPRDCGVALEACGSARHWSRMALRLGLRVLMMSPQHVTPYVKSNKNDVNDAEAIAEAAVRPTMRFVAVKSVEQQHIQQLHRARQLTVKHRTAQCNQLHGFLLEYGIESPKGSAALLRRLAEALEDADNELPFAGRALLRDLGDELRRLDGRVKEFDAQLSALARRMPACRRLMSIPGIGELTALVAAVGDASAFDNGRQMAAWLGLVPRARSTAGRPVLLGISKRGDRYLRTLLIHGGRAALRTAARRSPRRRGAVGMSRRWRWRTRTRASPGRCWRAGRRSMPNTWGRQHERDTRRREHRGRRRVKPPRGSSATLRPFG